MAALSSIVSVLLATVTLFAIVEISASTPVTQRLRLMSYSEEEVKGCYEYNKTLGVCFDVKKGSMKIQKTTGEVIVYYEELGPGMFFYQVLEQAFVGNTPTMFYVPGEVPKEPEILRAFLKFIKYKDSKEQREALKKHFLEAMSEVHYIPEVQLLELVSAALGNNSTPLEIVKPFHVLCFFLLKQSTVEIPSELRAEPDKEDETTDQHDREKRCTSLKSDPYSNTCEGMCGPRCWCWSIICGNCCWNRGCYQHDRCCEHDWFSTYCLLPVGFSCSRYKGYPRCLTSPWPWK